MCDGENQNIFDAYDKLNDGRFILHVTNPPGGFWGHSNRKLGLEIYADTEFVVQASIQDYYIPIAVDQMMKVSSNCDFLIYNCLHNHFEYNILDCKPERYNVDWSSFMVRTSIAKSIGINNLDSRICDGLFVESIMRHPNLRAIKLNKILVIHN